ncbi:transmembrane protease serine 9-like [Lytechinus variegatus]|uniref:transmembrane protease serine 9-like n=1 Tax=Lytechinus variegatus TaxID=7654 RepID=UPI001BB1F31D|nr:transmembrane protease serine 9-like [Lytechinus variegatus]
MTGKGEDINGYDNHGYDDHTEIGMRPMPTGPDNSDDSAVVFEEIKTTSKTPVKTTTMTALDPGEIVAIGVQITLVDRTFTDDLRDESTPAYVTFTNDIISSIDATYQHDEYYKEAAVISVSPGSIKVEIMMTFDMPMAGRERSNAIEFTLNNLTHNMQNAFDENTIIDVTTDIDECENNPCLNGGQCDNNEGSYSCSCNGGYTGVNCEQVTDCGFRPAHSPSSPRIIGGSQTQLGDWPWMVSLRDRSNVHRCAAVLINSTRAITAAHCVKKFDAAVLGDLLLSLQSAYHVETDVTAAIHPDYDINSITNDIAVIEFTTSVDFSDFVRPICYLDQDASATFRACYVTGWGHTSEGGHVSDTLLEATVELFDQTQCQSFYPDLTIPSTMMCAGRVDGLMDTCQGDTGGPLQCEDQDGRFHLIGITSFGYGCGRENYPGVYTKVSEYHDFITSADPQPEPEPGEMRTYPLSIPSPQKFRYWIACIIWQGIYLLLPAFAPV